MNNKNGMLVLLGVSTDGKPHAARFNGADAVALVKAAQAMGLKIGRPDTSEAMALVRGLPEGKVFASGKALVPLVKPELHDKLMKSLNMGSVEAKVSAPNPPPAEPDPAIKAATDTLWAAIKVGSTVLCWFKSESPSWWECVVVTIAKDSNTLTCRWRDYPAEKPRIVKRHEVALIGPGFKP